MEKEIKPVRFQLSITDEMDKRLLTWRKMQDDYCARTDAIRRIIQRVLDEDEQKRQET